ncbi:hypothetical protein GCM10007173_09960 [Glutamicibacter ardleyensis]|uniref:Uncharacterized protein n=1 Tax=Glutamicibacter ardleyensis TaxID=225894 RepID=A0ABQ2DCL2_9MICC|nr:hypothetical protein GCM10007173_09960 [Glutamicibacter ardleyensis]
MIALDPDDILDECLLSGFRHISSPKAQGDCHASTRILFMRVSLMGSGLSTGKDLVAGGVARWMLKD